MSAEDIKAAVRERDGHVCTRCGMTAAEHDAAYGKQLEVHRLVPGSVYTVEGCVTLCRPCHGPQPKRKPGQPDLDSRENSAQVRVPLDLYALLKESARRNGRPLGYELRAALTYYLKATVPP